MKNFRNCKTQLLLDYSMVRLCPEKSSCNFLVVLASNRSMTSPTVNTEVLAMTANAQRMSQSLMYFVWHTSLYGISNTLCIV